MWLNAARRAYKTWKSLDPEQRDALGAEAQRVRVLAMELGGPPAARFLEAAAEALTPEPSAEHSPRPRAQITAELHEAVEALSRACVAPATQIAMNSMPRSLRLGARVAEAGARRAAPRLQQRLRRDAPQRQLTENASSPTAWPASEGDQDLPPVATVELWPLLRAGEEVTACVAADGVFASGHEFSPASPHVLITNQRICLVSRRGMVKRRFEEDVSWPLTSFTSRINSSEGTALGAFMHVVTLFTQDGESVSAGFKNPSDSEAYKGVAVAALAPALG